MDPPIVHNDPYFWIRDDTRSDPEMLNHLRKENIYAEKMMAHTFGFKEDLYLELKSHVKETDEEVPYNHGPWLYYTRQVEGQAYTIRCRKASATSPEQILLDENVLAEGKAHCSVGSFVMSPDHRLVAYTADFTGDEVFSIYVLSLETNKVIETLEVECDSRVEWGANNESFYYLTLDSNHRPHKLWRHIPGTDQASDVCLYHEEDELFWLGLHKSSSDKYLILESMSSETGESHFIDLTAGADGTLQCFNPRRRGHDYGFLDHQGDRFYFRSNSKGYKNFGLVTTPAATTSESHWTPLFPYQESVFVENLQTFKNHLVIMGREGGYSQIWVHNFLTNQMHRVAFPEDAHDVSLGRNYVYDTKTIRLYYNSLTSPPIVYDYDMDLKTLLHLKSKEVPGYNPEFYASKTLLAPARDGTMIPMSLVYRKDLREDSKGGLTKGPVLLYGYGSYGLSIDPEFRITRLPLLDRGLIYVIAHIRGGGDLGYTWYQDHGKYLTKKNTFEDFIACGNDLIGRQITESKQMAINGRSAGGLLMGAVLNMAPTLATAAVCGVPFVDVMTTMCDPSIPLTVKEWEEWGNPNEEKYYSYMKGYSPVDNIRPANYPAVLITGGLHDPRVPYWEPAKYAAHLREKTMSKTSLGNEFKPILCKIDLDSGHFSASDRYHYLRETAFDLAFILDQLKLNNSPPVPYPSIEK